jgi:pyruvate formate lyase activating enzyme
VRSFGHNRIYLQGPSIFRNIAFAILHRYTINIQIGYFIDNRLDAVYILLVQSGTIFDIKKYSINDGPGIRTTVFFSGCPLSCLWCHNPESQSLIPELLYRAGRCLLCGDCIEACPDGAISLGESSNSIITDRQKCTGCQTCTTTCYSGAREFSGRKMTVQEVMTNIERDIPFYDESHGGVTFSGGEPLIQPTFLSALLKGCRAKEIHTVVDTSGFANWNVFEQIRDDVDLFLFDLKHMDSIRHREVTGVPNALILENLHRLNSSGAECIVRIPLIPGINDDENNLVESAKFLARLSPIQSVELMAYHDIAQAKYEALGRDYPLTGTKPPTEAVMHHAAELLRNYGLNVVIR